MSIGSTTRRSFERASAAFRVEPGAWRTPCWPRMLVLVAAIGGLVLAKTVATASDDPTDAGVKLFTTLVVVGSLLAIGVAISHIMTLAESRWRQVFRSRRLLACAASLAAVSAILGGSLLVAIHPFREVVARGQITALDITDAGWLFAAIICAVGAITALLGARAAHREERNWGESLGIHH